MIFCHYLHTNCHTPEEMVPTLSPTAQDPAAMADFRYKDSALSGKTGSCKTGISYRNPIQVTTALLSAVVSFSTI